MKKIIIIIMIITVITVITKKPIYAESSSLLSISPVIYNISLSPGKIYNYSLKVTNNLDVPLPIKLNVEPLDTPDDETNVGTKNKKNDNIASWVSFPATDMIIEAKKVRSIDFQIQVPDKVPLGGYYGMIFLHPLLPQVQGLPKEISAKIGILLMGSIGVQEIPLNKVEINKYAFDSFIYEKNNVEVNFLVKNKALNHFSAKPYLTIKSLFSSPQLIDLEEKFVFPGKSRKWEQNIILSQFPRLFYQATLHVSVGGGIQESATTYFLAFPFIPFFIFLTIVLIIIVVLRKKDRLKKVIRILVKG